MRSQSEIVPMQGYWEGAIQYPKATRYDASNGNWYVMHTDGRIFNCHPKESGIRWPIRFSIRDYDLDYPRIKALFNEEN